MLLAFQFAAAATLTWTADQDYILTGASKTATTGSLMVTTDVELTSALLVTPTATRILYGVLAYVRSAETFIGQEMKVPISAGTQVLVSSNGALTGFLYLTPVSAETIAT